MMTRLKIVAVLGVLFAMVLNSSAVQGVQLSFQGSDVVLRWPSQPCQTFIVGYKPDLQPGTQWTLLATTLAGAAGNETTYTHAGAFQGGGGQMMAMASSGGTSLTITVALTAEEKEARRIASRVAVQKALGNLIAQLEIAMEKAKAALAKRKALLAAGLSEAPVESASLVSIPSNEIPGNAAMQQAAAGSGFYFVAEYGEDSDGDGLRNRVELEIGLDLLKADSDNDLVLDGDEDFDGDGVTNYDEAVSGTFLDLADGPYPPPLLPFGAITYIEENFTISCSPGTTTVSAAGGTSSSQDLLFLDGADDMAHGITAVETSPGVLNVKLHSIYIGPEFGAFSPLAGNQILNPFPKPSAEQLELLAQANGEIDIGFAHVGEIRQGIYDQLSENTLDWARWRAEYGLRQSERLLQEINSGQKLATAAQLVRIRGNIVLQAKRIAAATSSLARGFGRAVGRYLPFVGAIMILANASAIAEQWNTAFQDYANDIRNGDDTTGSVAILAALSNDLAPGSGNFVLNALLR